MSCDWEQTSVGTICKKVVTGGTPLTKRNEFYEGGTVPWLKTKEVNFCRITKTENHITQEGLDGSAAKLIPVNSVIVAMYGQGDTAGRVAINKIPVCTNQACCNLVIDEEKADYRFVYYFLMDSYSELVRRKTGSAQPNLNTSIIKDFEIGLPPLSVQTSIGSFLSSLDEKIDLNTQTNQTLEQMAQALFKSWFVDFDPVIDNALSAGNPIPDELAERAAQRQALFAQGDAPARLPEATRALFPDRFEQHPDLGWIPAGWEVRATEDVAEKIAMGPFGSNIKVASFVDSGIPVISGQHLRETLLTEGEHNHVTEEHADKMKNSNVKAGDVVFTHAGNIGQVSLIPKRSRFERFVISQRQFYLRPNLNEVKPAYLVYFFRSHRGQHELLSNASQVGVPSIARPSSHLKQISLLVPSMDVLELFEQHCDGIFDLILSNRWQSQQLSDLRDTLLPKLLSGELTLPEMDTAMEATQ